MPAETLTAALRYAAWGWPVFPCEVGGKKPIVRHGCLDATTDPTIIRSWWGRVPDANLAIATGEPGPDVVDVDVKGDAPGASTYERLRSLGLLAGSFMKVVTPSGGWHLFYAGTQQRNSTRARHGVDFRGCGGYVVAPPSAAGGGGYAVEWYREPTGRAVNWSAILATLDPPPRIPQQPARAGRRGDFGKLVEWLEKRPAHDRNHPLYWAVCRALENGADESVIGELEAAIVRAGHDPRDAARTVASARRAAGGAA